MEVKSVVALEGIKMKAFHGVYPEEKEKGTDFMLNIYLDICISSKSLEDDDLSGTVDYQAVYELIVNRMRKSTHLLEKVSYDIGLSVLSLSETIQQVRIQLFKDVSRYMPLCKHAFISHTIKRGDN